jgi:serine/threonine-protein kinase PknK
VSSRRAAARRLLLAIAVCVALTACAGPAPRPPTSPAQPAGEGAAGGSGTQAPPPATLPEGQAAEWRILADAPFQRIESAVAEHGDAIWVAGGLLASGEATTETWRFTPGDGSWEAGPALPEPLHHAALASSREELYVMGGYVGGSFSAQTDAVLRLAGDAWTPAAPMPSARAAGAAAWDGERVVYGGGVLLGGGLSHEVLSFDGEAWSVIGNLSSPREHLAAASDGEGRTWILGGRMLTLASNTTAVDLVEGEEVRRIAQLPTPRGGVAAFHAPGVGACLTGGEEPARAIDAVECVAADGTVTVLPPLPEPRHGHGAAVIDGVAYILLGGPQPLLTVSATVQALEIGTAD